MIDLSTLLNLSTRIFFLGRVSDKSVKDRFQTFFYIVLSVLCTKVYYILFPGQLPDLPDSKTWHNTGPSLEI